MGKGKNSKPELQRGEMIGLGGCKEGNHFFGTPRALCFQAYLPTREGPEGKHRSRRFLVCVWEKGWKKGDHPRLRTAWTLNGGGGRDRIAQSRKGLKGRKKNSRYENNCRGFLTLLGKRASLVSRTRLRFGTRSGLQARLRNAAGGK